MCDSRGRHTPGNKTSQEDVAYVKKHIESFPAYESHYSRKSNPNRKYLSPDLSIAKMYALYKQKCTQDSKKPVSDWVYRRIFNEEYNLTFGRYVSYGFPANFFCVLISLFYPFSLACFFHATPLLTKSLSSHFVSLSLTHLLTFSLAPPLAHAISHFSTHFISICILHAYSTSELPLFSASLITSYLTIHRPKSDTCKSCDSFKAKIASEDNPTLKNQYAAEWELNKCKAERVYQQLRKDAAASKASPATGVIDMLTFDLQQTLPTPSITTNVFLRYILKY